MRMRALGTAAAFGIVSTTAGMAFGAWSSDPMANTVVAAMSGDQVQPKIVPIDDGGAYVSWFDSLGNGFDVFVMRIDANGDPVWNEPTLVADRSFSSTQDYGLSIDSSGAAVLAFRDDRFSPLRITANRVLLDGSLAWGEFGAQLGNGAAFLASPRVAGASDGSVYVAWTEDATARIAQLNSAGVSQWDDTLTDPTGQSFSPSDLHASDAPGETGEVVMLIARQGGFTTPRHLYAQKFDAAGNRLWGANSTAIFTSGSLQFGNFPTFTPDGTGGMVVAWYSSSPSLQCFVQRLDSTGAAELPANGLPVSTNATRLRVSPSAAYDSASGSIYATWIELNGAQSMHGVYAQRVFAGVRQWTDDGAVIEPLGNQEFTQARTLLYNGVEPASFYVRTLGFGNQVVEGDKLSAFDGAIAWSTDVSTAVSGKSRLTGTIAGSQAVMVWQDSRDDESDLYGQNVREDGSLGAAAVLGDLNGDGFVNGADLAELLANWGPCPDINNCPANLNGDGIVNGADLATLLANWTG